MIITHRNRLVGLMAVSLSLIAGCSGGSSSTSDLDAVADESGVEIPADTDSADNTVPQSSDDAPAGDEGTTVDTGATTDVGEGTTVNAGGTADEGEGTEGEGTTVNAGGTTDEGEGTTVNADDTTEGSSGTSEEGGQAGESAQNGGDSESLAPVSATGGAVDDGIEDDSPTATESASLIGPFIRDESRSAGPPSAPTGLTLLLTAENWLEFTWAPSSDDQSVEGYEVYRDGVLIDEVRGDTGYEFDYRSWLSTSFIDCNYTRQTYCENNQPTPGSSYSYTVVAVDNEGQKSAPSEAAVYQMEQLSSDPVDLTGYALVFDEEFNEGQLDRSRWKTALPWGPDTIINGELQYFVNLFGSNPPDYDPFVFTGETLQITGVETPPELLEAANNQPYMSGVITTADHFEMTYGYVEMSAKVGSGQGLLSTFYLFNQGFYRNKPEIDILEYIGSRPDKAYQTYHYHDSNRARSGQGERHSSPTMEWVAGGDLSSDFHNYSVLWEPELMIWYVDGIEVRRITGPRVSDEPMNIIAHMVVGSNWIGVPGEDVLPGILEIDYIKAWQQQ